MRRGLSLTASLTLLLGTRAWGAGAIDTGVEFTYPTQYTKPQVGAHVVSPAIPTAFKTRVIGAHLATDPTVSGGDLRIRDLSRGDVDTRDAQGNTPLILAAARGDLAAVRGWLDQGADANAVNRQGVTPLMAAAWGGFAPVVALLLEHGAAVDPTNEEGQTALMFAAAAGQTAVVRLLLAYHADRASRDRQGKDALAHAQAKGQTAVVTLLQPPTPAAVAPKP